MAPATLISRWAASACTQPAAPSFALPFTMVSYCIHAQSEGTCTDGGCSMRHDSIRCELCNCSFPPASLQQHQSGKQHLRNVASNGAQPSPPPQLPPTIQSVPASISPKEEGNTSTSDTDSRVNISGEGGLDFFVEGSGTSADPFFPSTNHNISIERTNASSNLSLQSITLRPPLGSWCE